MFLYSTYYTCTCYTCTCYATLYMCDHCVCLICGPTHSLQIQDIRLLHTKFNLLVGEKRVVEYIGVGGEMLTVLFRDYIYRKDLKGVVYFVKEGAQWKYPHSIGIAFNCSL